MHPNEQRNGHWAATSHLSGHVLVQPSKGLSSVAGQCAGSGCALIRQLANDLSETVTSDAETFTAVLTRMINNCEKFR